MESTSQPILEVRHLRKEYKKTIAVDDVSLSISPGVCFGLLGPNGAGKTTTIEIIEDIIEPTEGEILYKGKKRSGSFREEIGIQFQHTSLLSLLSVKETLQCFADLFHEPEELDTLITRCDLSSILNRRNTQLSGGQLQRLMLALALINKPNLVFLDEPSTGLDPQAKRNLWDIIEQMKIEGKTLIMTTHSMEEAEHLCDEIAIMDQGKIIAEGSPALLIKKYCGSNSIILPGTIEQEILHHLPFTWQEEGSNIRIFSDNIHEAIFQLGERDVDLRGMVVSSANLEDVFLQLTGKKLRD